MLFMRAGSCNLQVSALSSLTPGSPSGMHFTTTPVLLSKEAVFLISVLSLSLLSTQHQHHGAAAVCRGGRIEAVSVNSGPLYLTCKAVRTV